MAMSSAQNVLNILKLNSGFQTTPTKLNFLKHFNYRITLFRSGKAIFQWQPNY